MEYENFVMYLPSIQPKLEKNMIGSNHYSEISEVASYGFKIFNAKHDQTKAFESIILETMEKWNRRLLFTSNTLK